MFGDVDLLRKDQGHQLDADFDASWRSKMGPLLNFGSSLTDNRIDSQGAAKDGQAQIAEFHFASQGFGGFRSRWSGLNLLTGIKKRQDKQITIRATTAIATHFNLLLMESSGRQA